MLIPISAVDAINPAIARTRALLLQPFRWGIWLRFAVIALLSGELGGGGSFSYNGNFPTQPANHFAGTMPHLPQHFWPIALVIAGVGFVLLVVGTYIVSVMRFVLFESVLTGRPEIRVGWRKWRSRATSLFAFLLSFQVIMIAIAVATMLPIFRAASRSGGSPAKMLAIMLPALLVFFAIVLAALLVWVLVKDFCVPVMALEDVSIVEAWRRFGTIASGQTKSYAGYVLLKAVLALAIGVAISIVFLIVILVLAIPFAIVIGIGAGVGLTWNAVTITFAIIAGVFALLLILFLLGFLSTPVAVFFQSYLLQFYGSRYTRLAQYVYPAEATS